MGGGGGVLLVGVHEARPEDDGPYALEAKDDRLGLAFGGQVPAVHPRRQHRRRDEDHGADALGLGVPRNGDRGVPIDGLVGRGHAAVPEREKVQKIPRRPGDEGVSRGRESVYGW